VSAQIQIDADLVSQHAARVDQVAAQVRTASAAVDSMNLGGGAFGLLCAFLVPPVLVATTAGGMAISSTEHLLGRSTRELRGAVRDFAHYEDDTADAVDVLRRALEQGAS